MTQIITSQSSASNYHPSILKVDFSSATTKPKRLPVYKFKELKREQHRLADEAIKRLHYKAGISATLHELINCSSKEGDSRVTQATLALRLRCSDRTVRNHLSKMENDGLIVYSKNGWKVSNTTILLFVQHLNIHKEENISYYPTPPDEPPQNGSSSGGRNEGKEVAYALADASDAPKEPEWDDHLAHREPTEAEKQAVSERMKALKALHGLKHRKH